MLAFWPCGLALCSTFWWRFCLAIVVVLTLTRIIIKSVVTGQAPITLELMKSPGKNKQTKGGTRIDYITGDAIHASNRNT